MITVEEYRELSKLEDEVIDVNFYDYHRWMAEAYELIKEELAMEEAYESMWTD